MADNVTPCPAEIADDYQKKCRSSFQKGREVQEKMNAEAAKNSTAAEEPQPGDQTTLYTAKAAEVVLCRRCDAIRPHVAASCDYARRSV